MTGDDLLKWRHVMGFNVADVSEPISQVKAAEKLGYSREHYNRLESGKAEIPDHIPILCAAYYHKIKPWPECL